VCNILETYSPFGADHPASSKNIAIFTDCSHGVADIYISYSETIGNFKMLFWFS